MSSDYLSELEELILLAVGILHGNAYGYTITQEIAAQADRLLSLATVHTGLYRLERKGLMRSTLGGETARRGGRRKRLFTLTGAGQSALQARRAVREQMWNTLSAMTPLKES